MGYRSVVAIAVNKTVEIPENVKTALNEDLEYSETETAHYWTHNYIKWYDSYDSVNTIEEWLYELDDDQYGFIRVGDENDDIDMQGEPGLFGLYTVRTIEVNGKQL